MSLPLDVILVDGISEGVDGNLAGNEEQVTHRSDRRVGPNSLGQIFRENSLDLVHKICSNYMLITTPIK